VHRGKRGKKSLPENKSIRDNRKKKKESYERGRGKWEERSTGQSPQGVNGFVWGKRRKRGRNDGAGAAGGRETKTQKKRGFFVGIRRKHVKK